MHIPRAALLFPLLCLCAAFAPPPAQAVTLETESVDCSPGPDGMPREGPCVEHSFTLDLKGLRNEFMEGGAYYGDGTHSAAATKNFGLPVEFTFDSTNLDPFSNILGRSVGEVADDYKFTIKLSEVCTTGQPGNQDVEDGHPDGAGTGADDGLTGTACPGSYLNGFLTEGLGVTTLNSPEPIPGIGTPSARRECRFRAPASQGGGCLLYYPTHNDEASGGGSIATLPTSTYSRFPGVPGEFETEQDTYREILEIDFTDTLEGIWANGVTLTHVTLWTPTTERQGFRVLGFNRDGTFNSGRYRNTRNNDIDEGGRTPSTHTVPGSVAPTNFATYAVFVTGWRFQILGAQYCVGSGDDRSCNNDGFRLTDMRFRIEQQVPLPAGLILTLTGLAVLGGLRARSKKSRSGPPA